MSESQQDLCKKMKIIHDVIHGYISLTYFATLIIDTKYFQRLRKLKQLGTCVWVFPTGTHTRFEHSIGTYYVADQLLERIVTSTDPQSIDQYLNDIDELNNYYERIYQSQVHTLDEYVCELIKIAALCHDLGHGPLSHVFDDVLLPAVGKADHPCATHEERSGLLLELLIKNNKILSNIIHDNEIKFMKNLINPNPNIHKGFIYQIVSNSLTGLDVDKFDYLARDIYMLNFQALIDSTRLVKHIKIIDNNIVYPEQSIDDIYNIFQTRFRLHKQVYCHKVVISVQFIIVELLILLDDILHISDSITDMDKFCELTDEYIFESLKVIGKFTSNLTETQFKNYKKAIELVNKLDMRKLYTTVSSRVLQEKIDITKLLSDMSLPDSDDIIVFQNKIGFVSGNKPNPFDSILVYSTKNTKISDKYMEKMEVMSLLLPKSYQEYLVMIFYKDKDNKSRIKELKELFKSLA